MASKQGFILHVGDVTCHMADETVEVQGPRSLKPLYDFVVSSTPLSFPHPHSSTQLIHNNKNNPELCVPFAHLQSQNRSFLFYKRQQLCQTRLEGYKMFSGNRCFWRITNLYLINTHLLSFSPAFSLAHIQRNIPFLSLCLKNWFVCAGFSLDSSKIWPSSISRLYLCQTN